MRRLTVLGCPRTKKNSAQIIMAGNRRRVIASKAYRKYEPDAIRQLKDQWGDADPIGVPCEIKCVFYMETRRKVDLTNLLEAIDDILTRAGIIEDDNCRIVASHDGSRVYYDKNNPRTEITITCPLGIADFTE